MKKIFLAMVVLSTISLGCSSESSSKSTNAIYKVRDFKSSANDDSDYCVEIFCKGNRWKETIRAFNATKAKLIAESKYPNCTVGAPFKGACN